MSTFVIRGKRYPVSNVFDLDLNDLRNLKRETGVTIGEFREMAGTMYGKSIQQILMDESALMAMSVIIWASRRKAGENITLEQACDFSLVGADFSVIHDADDDVDGEPAEEPEDPRSARRLETSPAGPPTELLEPLPDRSETPTPLMTSSPPSEAG